MFYYDEHEKMYNEMKMEMEERDKALSSEEREWERQKSSQEARAIMERAERKQKEEYQIPSNMQIQYVCNDVILVTHIKHRIPFIKKGSEYIEAYKFPDIHHALLKKKAQFNTCMVNGDDLLVFTL